MTNEKTTKKPDASQPGGAGAQAVQTERPRPYMGVEDELAKEQNRQAAQAPVQETEPEPEPEPEEEAVVGDPMPEPEEEADAEPVTAFQYSIPHNTLRDLCDVLRGTMGEMRAWLEGRTLHFKGVDPAHVAMFDVQVKVPERHEGPETTTHVIDVETLYGDLQKVGRTDEQLTVKCTDGGELVLTTHDGMDFTYPLIDPSGLTEPKIPDLDLPGRVELDGTYIRDFLKRARDKSDHVEFSAREGRFDIEMYNEGAGARWDPPIEYSHVDGREDEVCSLFSVDYLWKTMKKGPMRDTVELELGRDYPLKVHFTVGDHAKGTFVMAPRIED